MAADTAIWVEDLKVVHIVKIIRIGDSLFAGAGRRPVILSCAKWIKNSCLKDEKPSDEDVDRFGALWLRPSGLFRISHKFEIYDDPSGIAAEGAHREFMMGAMLAGKSAEEAVGLAIQYGAYAGGN